MALTMSGLCTLLSCCCFFFLAAKVAATTASTSSATAKSSPAQSWLAKLNGEERDEISRRCSEGDAGANFAHSPKLHAANATVHELAAQWIYNGELAPRGLFLSSAALTIPSEGLVHLPVCGASLISPRHLLTAAHCVIGTVNDEEYSIQLLAGGVCPDAAASDACPSRDMDVLEIEFAIKEHFIHTARDRRNYVRRTYDFAIIQLKRPLSAYLPEERAAFACLPVSNDADQLPIYLNEWGWGMRGLGQYETPTVHQRYIAAVTRPLPGWTGDSLSQPACSLPPTPTFCLFSPSGATAVGRPGDSGSGVVDHKRGSLTNVLYGIHTSSAYAFYSLTPDGEVQLRYASVVEATGHYLDDLCYYLGHCAHAGGLKTRLVLGSVMLTQPRSALPPIAPFRMITPTEEALHEEYCAQMSRQTIPPLTWAVALVEQPPSGEDPDRVLCTATLISSAHLVASRRCIVDYLRTNEGGRETVAGVTSRLRLIASESETCYRPNARGELCARVREGRARVYVLRPEFIAWHRVGAGHHNSTHVTQTDTADLGIVYTVFNYRPPYTMDSDVAFIQLRVEDAAELAASRAIRPACLEQELLGDEDYVDRADRRVGAIAHGVRIEVGVDMGVAWLRGRVGNQSDGMPSDLLLADRDSAGEAQYAGAWEAGAGLLDTRNNRILGQLLKRGTGQRFYYVHLWEYHGVFCTYLGLGCRPNSAGVSYLDNRIPAFDRFVYLTDG